MSEIDIQKALTDYATSGSNEAFKHLVEHFGGLVYATARRQLNGDEHLAQDATQRVFADLAKKATKLRTEGSLGGWLHCHTCFLCSEMRRSDLRRRARENAAAELDSVKEDSNEAWLEAEANLDEAINDLREPDRIAIIARYFERASLRAIGKLLDTSEDAAQKRVTRAVERLREKLGQRGVAISAAALVAGLECATAALPAGLISKACESTAPGSGGWMQLFWTKPAAMAATALVLVLTLALPAITADQAPMNAANQGTTGPTPKEHRVETAAIAMTRRNPTGHRAMIAPTFSVQFVNAENDEPIPRMKFKLFKKTDGVYHGASVVADETGRWEMTSLARDVRGVGLWSRKAGWSSAEIYWNFDDGRQLPSNYVFKVYPAQRVMGRVMDDRGEPIVGAMVSQAGSMTDLESRTYDEGNLRFATTGPELTDENGFWVYDMVALLLTGIVLAAHHRFRPVIVTVRTTISGRTSATLFTLLAATVFYTLIEDAKNGFNNVLASVLQKRANAA